jgi:hypothetical protein
LTVQSERFSHENLQLQAECQRQFGRSNEIEAIRKEFSTIEQEIKRFEEETQTLEIKILNQEKIILEVRK